MRLDAGERVLVTRLDYLGDVVLSLPLVDALAREYPGIEIDYLARRPGADLLDGDARFARVFTLDRGAGLADSLRLVRALRARRYRAVIDLYSNPRSAWLSWLSGASVRVGGDRRGRRHLYTHALRVPTSVRAATAHHLYYGGVFGIDAGAPARPTLAPGNDERVRARETLEAAGVDTAGAGPLVGIHPGGKWPVKRWSAESFAALAAMLVERAGARVVVFAGPGEERHTDAVRARLGEAARYLPVLPVRAAAAAIASLDAMVACDGGIMHVSVAVGTPTVGIFGSAEPDVWFPYQGLGPFRVAAVPMPCRPCHRHECPLGHTNCLNTLTPGYVFDEVAGVLELAGGVDAR